MLGVSWRNIGIIFCANGFVQFAFPELRPLFSFIAATSLSFFGILIARKD